MDCVYSTTGAFVTLPSLRRGWASRRLCSRLRPSLRGPAGMAAETLRIQGRGRHVHAPHAISVAHEATTKTLVQVLPFGFFFQSQRGWRLLVPRSTFGSRTRCRPVHTSHADTACPGRTPDSAIRWL